MEHLPTKRRRTRRGRDGHTIAPWAMLFVRCHKGISHHPDESIDPEDAAVALEVMSRFLRLLVEEKKNGGKVLERT